MSVVPVAGRSGDQDRPSRPHGVIVTVELVVLAIGRKPDAEERPGVGEQERQEEEEEEEKRAGCGGAAHRSNRIGPASATERRYVGKERGGG